ncbi:hypothetical protein [Actinophytocola algeriensis]|uniref:TetR family transcriptional regulator n=1 Tax=Actinophytocola algeriensis TaxID=1768010 RepID=A0A7W7Q9H0_9PSEU|nr:hypothetical protein [Actinophytocola algeriensis]MBB4909124.1 hypothetical protein [Actinophytocola algeriensis]MBE1474488.1 hypothetical protein [Actinophytocola algeriensis]
MAFLAAVVEVVGRNKRLMAALGAEVASMPKPHDGPAREHPLYQSWHGHITRLLREADPALDAELLAGLLLAGLQSDPILRLLERGETDRLAKAVQTLASGLLGS